MVKDGTPTNTESNKLLLQSNKKIVSKKSRKNYYVTGLRYTLGENSLTVLEKLAEGQSQTEIAKTISLTKKGVNYWVKKFLELDFIKFYYGTKPKYYRITPLGLAIITRSEKTSFCMMEDYPSKFELIADHSKIEWEKLGAPKNWIKQGFRIGDVMVVKTSQHIIIHTGQIAGKNEIACAEAAGMLKCGVKAWLQTHGVLMSDLAIEVHKPIFKFYSKEAEILHDHFGNVSTDAGVLDNSPPGIPHEEYARQAAINKLEEANRIAQIVRDVQELKKDVETIKTNFLPALENLTKSLQEVTDLLKPKSPINSTRLHKTDTSMMII